jgi:hypothetical protein
MQLHQTTILCILKRLRIRHVERLFLPGKGSYTLKNMRGEKMTIEQWSLVITAGATVVMALFTFCLFVQVIQTHYWNKVNNVITHYPLESFDDNNAICTKRLSDMLGVDKVKFIGEPITKEGIELIYKHKAERPIIELFNFYQGFVFYIKKGILDEILCKEFLGSYVRYTFQYWYPFIKSYREKNKQPNVCELWENYFNKWYPELKS